MSEAKIYGASDDLIEPEIGDWTPEAYPIAVTLRFRSVEERDRFMGGLSDGWGEGVCGLT